MRICYEKQKNNQNNLRVSRIRGFLCFDSQSSPTGTYLEVTFLGGSTVLEDSSGTFKMPR